MKILFSKLIILFSLMNFPYYALGTTSLEYEATCKYTDNKNTLKYSGSCQGNWGFISNWEKETATIRYTMTFPNESHIDVYIYDDGAVTINGIPAKELEGEAGMKKFITSENEIYEFTKCVEDE